MNEEKVINEIENKTQRATEINLRAAKNLTAEQTKQSQRKANFRLTERDLEILQFLFDQKFASLEQLYFRFFDARDSILEPLPNNLFTTRQRLQKLKQLGLIATERVYSEAKSIYLISPLGFQFLESKRPEAAYAKPITKVDFRSFEHDMKANDCRIAIERQGLVMKWISERQVRMKGFTSEFSDGRLPKEIVPDGIFISAKGKRVAFEIETTKRMRSRYWEKKEAFERVMGGSEPLLHLVIWVGATEQIYRDLKVTTERARGFEVESYDHFLSKIWPTGRPEKVGLR